MDGRRSLTNGTFGDDDRAASEVAAMALVLGIVVLGVTTIVLVASPQLAGNQQTAEVGQAEQALTQLDSDAARVATGSTSTQTTDLGLRGNGGTLDTRPESGTITVTYIHAPPSVEDGVEQQVVNRSLGAIVYENDETTVAYQGGGVWRSDGAGSVMISPPEITFQNKTLTMHVVATESMGSVHSDVQLTRSSSKQQYPNATANLENKVESALVQVTIQSRYYEAWGRYFEDESNTIVQYNHGNEEVTILFVALPVEYAPEAGVVATSGPGEIRLEGEGSYIDSYNSSNGTYDETKDSEGSVKSAGEISMFGGSQIDGDAEADDDISINTSAAQIDGNATAGERVYEHDEDSVTGEVRENTSGVPPVPPIDGLVDRRVNDLASENDNDETAVVKDDELDLTESNELQSGEYYLENLHLNDETLVLNTTNGNITIGVENWVKLDGKKESGNIKVKGDGDVRVFVKSEEKTTVNPPSEGKQELHFYVERNGSVTVGDDSTHRSTQFLVFGPSEFQGSIAGASSKNPNVTAVIIAPAGPEGEGTFHIKHGELFGAVMTGNLTLGNPAEVHFDHAIIGTQIPIAPTVPRLEYLYVMEHEIRVESS